MDERSRREQTRACQRAWRARRTRIDLYADPSTLAAMELRRERWGVMSTNSGALNAIVREWAELKGFRLPGPPAVRAPAFSDHSAQARARAIDSAALASLSRSLPAKGLAPSVSPATRPAKAQADRVRCGARRRRDGMPCEALSVPGRRRCRWHGGLSTGPKTAEGIAKVTANLPRRDPGNGAASLGPQEDGQ